MSYNPGQTGQEGWIQASQGGRLPFIQKVYGLFLAGIVVSILASGVVVSSPKVNVGQMTVPSMVYWSLQHYLLVVIGFFVTFFVARAVRRRPGLNVVMMFVFTALSGVMIAPRLWIATMADPGAVPLAGGITGLMFAGLTLYAFASKTDFNFLGAGLFVGLLGLIGGSLLNAFFFHSAWAVMFMAWGAVLLFSGFVLYDTSQILRRLPENEWVTGSLELYLDFINMFLAVLSIVSGGRR